MDSITLDEMVAEEVVEGDVKLLREYVKTGSQRAFAVVVKRHMRMVYATCLREVRDANLAEDAAQNVFLALSNKARSVQSYKSLSGWLFLAARLEGRNTLRREIRRNRIEERHATLVSSQMEGGPEWFRHERVVNDALSALNDTDREAVLLRYFEGRTAREIADVLGVSETAAERKLSRAVLKMREHLAVYGAATTVALIALLQEESAQAVPANCITSTLERHAAAHGGAGAHAGAAALKGLSVQRGLAAGGAVLLIAGLIGWSRHNHLLPAGQANIAPAIMLTEKPLAAPSSIDVGAPLLFHTAASRGTSKSPHATIKNGILSLTLPSYTQMNSSYTPQPFMGNAPANPAFLEQPPDDVPPILDTPHTTALVNGSGAISEEPLWTGDIRKRAAVFTVEEDITSTVLRDEAGKKIWSLQLAPNLSVMALVPYKGKLSPLDVRVRQEVAKIRSDGERQLRELKLKYKSSSKDSAKYKSEHDAIVQDTKDRTNDIRERARGAIFASEEGGLVLKITIGIDRGTCEIRTADDQLKTITTADIAKVRYDTLKGGIHTMTAKQVSSVQAKSEVVYPILPEIDPHLANGELRLVYRDHQGAFVVREVVRAHNGAVTRSFTDIMGRPAAGLHRSDTSTGVLSALKKILPI